MCQEIEDEIHFTTRCQMYKTERLDLYTKVRNTISNLCTILLSRGVSWLRYTKNCHRDGWQIVVFNVQLSNFDTYENRILKRLIIRQAMSINNLSKYQEHLCVSQLPMLHLVLRRGISYLTCQPAHENWMLGGSGSNLASTSYDRINLTRRGRKEIAAVFCQRKCLFFV